MRRSIWSSIPVLLALACFHAGTLAVGEDDFSGAENGVLLRGMRSEDLRGSDLQSRFRNSLSVTPSYYSHDPRTPVKLFDDGVKHDALDFKLKSSLPGGLQGEGELAFSSFDSQAERLDGERKKRFMHFKLSGDAGFLGYGSEFRSIGQGFRQPLGGGMRLDQEGTESWVERKLGWLSVKAVNSKYWNNVEADPRRPRTVTSLNGTVASLSFSSGPTLSLSYMGGTAETGGGPMRGVQESTVQQYSATLYYWRPTWDVSLTSMLMPSKDKLRPEREVDSVYHEVNLTWRPTDAVTITPYLSYSDERYKWTGTHSMNPMAMLSVSWTSLFSLVDFYSFTNYMRTKSTDGYMDSTNVMSLNSFVYQLGAKNGERYLSFDVLYTRYSDAIYRDYSYKEILGRVMYTVTSF